DAAQSAYGSALIRSQLILSDFVQQGQCPLGLARLDGELCRLHQVLGIGRGSAVEEIRNRTAKPLGKQPQTRERRGGLVVLHLADEAFGSNARRQPLLGPALGDPGGLETFAKRVHSSSIGLACLNNWQ